MASSSPDQSNGWIYWAQIRKHYADEEEAVDCIGVALGKWGHGQISTEALYVYVYSVLYCTDGKNLIPAFINLLPTEWRLMDLRSFNREIEIAQYDIPTYHRLCRRVGLRHNDLDKTMHVRRPTWKIRKRATWRNMVKAIKSTRPEFPVSQMRESDSRGKGEDIEEPDIPGSPVSPRNYIEPMSPKKQARSVNSKQQAQHVYLGLLVLHSQQTSAMKG